MALRVHSMWRGIFIFLLLAISTIAAEAQRRQINPIPFAHEPCSVLDGRNSQDLTNMYDKLTR